MGTLRILALAVLVYAFSAAQALASQALTIDIYGPGQSRVNLTIATPLGVAGGPAPSDAAKFQQLVEQNLDFLPFIRVVPGTEVLGGVRLAGVARDDIDFRRFQVSRVDMVMTAGWQPSGDGSSRLECRVYETFTSRLVVGRAYAGVRADNLSRVADLFCAAFMEALTGHDEFFRSIIAFSRTGRDGSRQIWTVTPQGRELRQITFFKGSSISPSWSKDGRYLAFAHHSNHSHTLGVWDSVKNRIFRTKVPGTTIGGTAFTNDGHVVVAMTRGNMDIFELTTDLTRIARPLVQNWAIDVSPCFTADGRRMVFTSDRQGNPHVFIKDMDTGKETRVTYDGKYNTSPSVSPDGKLVVFSRRTPEGHRIFLHDMETGRERQLSFGPGSDEEPAFSPDGYFVCFASNRTGAYQLYLTTRHGAEPKLLPTGGPSTHPVFGSRLRQ
ncbi:TolB protein [Desulfobaculum xiamenense]|uniref:TolB protein n=1 Tax=Desulfobaculum xiamenense TaxID=995050 RepID=A0A846QPM4_9BACT|nr:PD40 domain-containing protein [Desulfobaculum xiamenense]NJB67365.1 TolB protein [Desulfobaculum xiamenense]